MSYAYFSPLAADPPAPPPAPPDPNSTQYKLGEGIVAVMPFFGVIAMVATGYYMWKQFQLLTTAREHREWGTVAGKRQIIYKGPPEMEGKYASENEWLKLARTAGGH